MTPQYAIPKTIHYCWFGGSPISELGQRCMQTWRECMPAYRVEAWDEGRLDKTITYVRLAYAARQFAFVADYVRLQVLYEHGGLYFDTDIEVVRAMVKSKDGAKVPLNILRKKGLRLNGEIPTLLTGYGGYGISESPEFTFARRIWFDQGGVIAIANLRGGGEFGEEWHRAGNLTRNQARSPYARPEAAAVPINR